MSDMRDKARALEAAIALEGRTMDASNVEEFFNEEHDKRDGRFTSVGGSAGWHDVIYGGKKVDSETARRSLAKAGNDLVDPLTRREERIAKLKKIALITGAVALAAGAVFIGVQMKQENDRAKQHLVPGSDKVHITRRWEDVDKHGKKVRVMDSSGKLTDKQAKGMLEQLKDIAGLHPVEGRPATLMVRDEHQTVGKGANAFVMNRPGARSINVNYKQQFGAGPGARFNRAMSAALPWFSKVFTDKSGRHQGDSSRYVVVHEYGHVADLDGERKAILSDRAKGVPTRKASLAERILGVSTDGGPGDTYRARRRMIHNKNRFKMRKYAQTNGHEGYAEAFAEYHLSSGKTTDSTAHDYAREHGWRV